MDPLTIIAAATAAIRLGQEVLAIYERIQTEGRDMTAEELAVIQAANDLKTNAVVAGLIEASKA